MDINYLYTKLRRNFGRQYIPADDGPKLLNDQKPDKSFAEKYIYKNPISRGTQFSNVMSENHANTYRIDFADHGMNHSEGGWPKEVDTTDEEAILRFRKKIERLDNYINAMKNLTVPMEHAILQNNAVNIYEQYFVGAHSALSVDKATCRIQNTFRYTEETKRPVTHCSWSPSSTEFVLSHCNTTFQAPGADQAYGSYIWDVENSNTPLLSLQSNKSPTVTLEYNPRDNQWLAAGLLNGQVAHFDCRKGSDAIGFSVLESSHRDPIHSLIWINSKSGMEFFTASSDGAIKWWDSRKLDHPTDIIILDLNKGDKPNMARALPASCLEYEASIPVKYMVGTENGYIISGNRKGTNQQERLPWMMKAHSGPIYSIHRNQAFNKNVLVVGDWSAKIFSEDCKESAIMWSNQHRVKTTAGEWSAGRASVFFLTREDGVLDLYDILQEQKSAFLSFKLSNYPLTCLRVRDDGELVIVGNSVGTAFVVRYSSTLAETSKNDKVFLSAMFDRESRREKLLEAKNKEIRFKLREIALAKESQGREEVVEKSDFEIAVENYKNLLESEYFAAVQPQPEVVEKPKQPARH